MSQNLQGFNGLTAAFTSGALARASTASLVQIVSTVTYSIAGRLLSRAAINNNPFTIEPGSGILATAPNAFVNLAAGESCAFAIFLDQLGAVTYAQGPIVPVGQLCPVPVPPTGVTSLTSTTGSGKVIIGALKVVNTTNTFIPGTTLLSAAGVTDTYFNFSTHPGTPI